MHEDMVGDFQLHRCEVPDSLDTRLNHCIRHLLRRFGRSSDDPQMDTHSPSKSTQLFKTQYRPLVNPLAYFVWVRIEGCHDPQAKLREPFIAEERRPQVSRPHKKSVGYVVPPEKCFNGLDEFRDRVARFRFSNNARICQIFTDLYRNAVQVSTDNATGYLANSLGIGIHQVMVVLRQSP